MYNTQKIIKQIIKVTFGIFPVTSKFALHIYLSSSLIIGDAKDMDMVVEDMGMVVADMGMVVANMGMVVEDMGMVVANMGMVVENMGMVVDDMVKAVRVVILIRDDSREVYVDKKNI